MRRVLVALILLTAASSAHAGGMLIPKDKTLPPLTLVDQKVTVTIDDQAAVTRVEQAFRNNTNHAVEATYLFPVPKGASVRKFTMWVGDKEVPGEILEAKQARKIYHDIVYRTKDPGLLEYVDNQLIQIKVFPVPAKGEQRVSLTYTSVAESDNGLIEYTYPMKTVGKSPELLQKFALLVKLKSQHSLTNIYSPTHAITIGRPSDKEANIGFEKNQAILDRDFQLYYQAGQKDVGLTAATHRPNAGQPGYFMMLMSPRAELSKVQKQPRDFVYVIDTSGSMRIGNRIGQAKKALKFCLDNLGPDDRFAMLNFASTVTKYTDKLQNATTDNVQSAKKWVDDLEPTGGTFIDGALQDALAMRSSDPGRMYTMVFFTDGQPTFGEKNINKIIENVNKKNTGNTRIFSFGVGNDVNTVLLDGLADNTKGTSSYVREGEDIEAKVSSLYAKISNPVLANLKMTVAGNVKVSEIYPPQLPDLFHGNQLVVFGRYTGSGKATVTLTGTVGMETKEFVYELNFADKTGDEKAFVEDLWARRKVGYLLDQIRVQGESKEVVDEVIQLAKRYGITTPYTSYLLVPDGPGGPAGGPAAPQALRQLGDKQPAPVAEFGKQLGGKGAKGGGGGVGQARLDQENDRLKDEAKNGDGKAQKDANAALEQQSSLQKAAANFRSGSLHQVQAGRLGVDFAVQNNALRFQNQTVRTASRNVQNRNVVEVGGVWIDDGFDPKLETVSVKAQSEAYFKILDRHPEVKDVFALGNYLIWVTPSGKALVIDQNHGVETLENAAIDALFVAAAKK